MAPAKPARSSGKAKTASRASKPRAAAARPKSGAAAAKPKARKSAKVVLLSGGNPQIAKADGDAPVQAYLDAMPGWKSALGKRLDALVVRTVPGVRKAVKWNSPLYSADGESWFLGLHAFTRFVRVTFFRGTSLKPLPPGPSKSGEVRYLDVHEEQKLDEAQFVAWLKQAAPLRGWSPGTPM
jgi:hypothetical protein